MVLTAKEIIEETKSLLPSLIRSVSDKRDQSSMQRFVADRTRRV